MALPLRRQEEIPWETSFRYDGPVLAVVLLVLACGWILKTAVEGRTLSYSDIEGGLSLQHPSSWSPRAQKDTLLTLQDLRSQGAIKPTFSVSRRELPPSAPKPPQELVSPFIVERGSALLGYRVLEVSELRVDGLPAVSITYAYVAEPSGSALQATLPVVVQAVDVLVPDEGSLLVFTLAAPAQAFEDYRRQLPAILRSVRLRAGG